MEPTAVVHPLVVYNNHWKRESHQKFSKIRVFPSFAGILLENFEMSGTSIFEKGIKLENFETVENLHQKCQEKPNMSVRRKCQNYYPSP